MRVGVKRLRPTQQRVDRAKGVKWGTLFNPIRARVQSKDDERI